jgi:hypothetical protein
MPRTDCRTASGPQKPRAAWRNAGSNELAPPAPKHSAWLYFLLQNHRLPIRLLKAAPG